MTHDIIKPETHPDHHVVGRRFRAHDGHVYYCDSYDPSCGYWMTREDCVGKDASTLGNAERRNVSERAIGRTFHRISR